MKNWYLPYLGLPWARVPDWPRSANCGELVRHVFLDIHGIDSEIIPVPDAGIQRDCIQAMIPQRYGLEWLPEGHDHRDFDVCFLGKARYLDHCGVGCWTADGYMILHCQTGAGTGLDTPAELAAIGFTKQLWARHPAFNMRGDEVRCG